MYVKRVNGVFCGNGIIMLLKGFFLEFVRYVKDRWLKLLIFLRGIKKEKKVL